MSVQTYILTGYFCSLCFSSFSHIRWLLPESLVINKVVPVTQKECVLRYPICTSAYLTVVFPSGFVCPLSLGDWATFHSGSSWPSSSLSVVPGFLHGVLVPVKIQGGHFSNRNAGCSQCLCCFLQNKKRASREEEGQEAKKLIKNKDVSTHLSSFPAWQKFWHFLSVWLVHWHLFLWTVAFVGKKSFKERLDLEGLPSPYGTMCLLWKERNRRHEHN